MRITGSTEVNLDLTATFTNLHPSERVCVECGGAFKDKDQIVGVFMCTYQQADGVFDSIAPQPLMAFVHKKGKVTGSCFEDYTSRFIKNNSETAISTPTVTS
jgi:hypothetical protein